MFAALTTGPGRTLLALMVALLELDAAEKTETPAKETLSFSLVPVRPSVKFLHDKNDEGGSRFVLLPCTPSRIATVELAMLATPDFVLDFFGVEEIAFVDVGAVAAVLFECSWTDDGIDEVAVVAVFDGFVGRSDAGDLGGRFGTNGSSLSSRLS